MPPRLQRALCRALLGAALPPPAGAPSLAQDAKPSGPLRVYAAGSLTRPFNALLQAGIERASVHRVPGKPNAPVQGFDPNAKPIRKTFGRLGPWPASAIKPLAPTRMASHGILT